MENPLYEYLTLAVSYDEKEKIKDWLQKHVDLKTPYNYNDLCYCVMPLPYLKDVQDPKSLFCSQACVLALREGIEENEDLKKALATLNSRTCTPNKLYKFIKPFCIKNDE